jgi:hypothetical protein
MPIPKTDMNGTGPRDQSAKRRTGFDVAKEETVARKDMTVIIRFEVLVVPSLLAERVVIANAIMRVLFRA